MASPGRVSQDTWRADERQKPHEVWEQGPPL